MKQLKVPSLPFLKCHFGISNGGLGSAFKLSNVNLDLNLWRKKSSSPQKRAFKDTPLLFLNDLHTSAVELLYKCNITLVDLRMAVYRHRCD